MDFGCVTIDATLKLYLFGTPGQDRFGFMWNDLARGALGALVVVDSTPARRLLPGRRLLRARQGAVRGRRSTRSTGTSRTTSNEVRWALAVSDAVPVVAFDARDRLSVRDALLVVLDRALDRAMRARHPN